MAKCKALTRSAVKGSIRETLMPQRIN